MKNIYDKIDSYKDDLVKDVCSLISLKSVATEVEDPKKPFGNDIADALDYVMNLSKKFGFKTNNMGYHVATADYGNLKEGSELIGGIVHIDTVPAGNNWNTPAFEATIIDGVIYGRGAVDDKAPAIALTYALRALKESGVEFHKTFRIIYGCDEESGMRDLDYYNEHGEPLSMAFSPDASFPVCYAEKGISSYECSTPFFNNIDTDKVFIKNIEAGKAYNVVPNTCNAVLGVSTSQKDEVVEALKNLKLEKGSVEVDDSSYATDNTLNLSFGGDAAHASEPWDGFNAISLAFKILENIITEPSQLEKIKVYNKLFGFDLYGESLGIFIEDDEMGKLTHVTAVVKATDNGELFYGLNMRYPKNTNIEELTKKLEGLYSENNLKFNIMSNASPHYVPKDSKLVQSIMEAYKDYTGDTKAEPITMGGGTYARKISGAVSTGTYLDNGGGLHQPNEYLSIDNLIAITKIYATCIHKLACEL